MNARHTHWWETRTFAALLVLVSIVPLLWPTVPPLVDLPGHMGRYQVQLDRGHTASLAQFYDFHWALIGNLGVDLLIVPMAKLFGLELGTKLIVMTIPALTVAGLLWICREVNREVQPTALFALPLAYGHPFQFGFVNFALAMALALMAFALWLRLARLGKLRTRAIIFLFIGPLLWLTHTFGWGMLGVLAFSAELIRQHDRGGSWPHAIWWAGVHCLCLAPPLALMLVWRTGHVGGQTFDWFNLPAKLLWIESVLRDRWRWWDFVGVLTLGGVMLFAALDKRLEFSRNLAASAFFVLVVFLCLPRVVFGSAYADMRLAPYFFALAIIAVRVKPGVSARFARSVALAGLAFTGARLAATTASLAIGDRDVRAATGALDVLPRGSRVVSFVGSQCTFIWPMFRLGHVPALAMVRRDAFSNDQWVMPGAQLLRVRYSGWFAHDPSEIVVQQPCKHEMWQTIDWSLSHFPRDKFDYVWLIDPPAYDVGNMRGLTAIWRNGTNVLYRVDR